MNLIKIDPKSFRTNWLFPSVFDDFFGRSIGDFMGSDFVSNMPSVNISETDEGYHVDVATPGLSKDDFKISLEKDRLTISSEKSSSEESTHGRYTRREFNFSKFSRSFFLPETVDKDKISAKYDNGVLRLVVPKKAEVIREQKCRVIEIA